MMTTYKIFCRYFNEATRRVTLNTQEVTWHAYEETETFKNLKEDDHNVKEVVYLSEIEMKTEDNIAAYDYVIQGSYVSNPKYDMLFLYDGLGYARKEAKSSSKPNGSNSGSNNQDVPPIELYYEKMKRITVDVWFEHSTWHSLKAVMNKAEELVDIIGKNGVKIGKVVPLDQYIDIV